MRRSRSSRIAHATLSLFRTRALRATVLLTTALPAAVLAQAGGGAPVGDVPAQECCLGLLFPVSARSVALAGALSARRGIEAAFANPAGLAALDSTQLAIHHTTILGADQANTLSLLVPRRYVGTLGLGYQLLDYGTQEATDEVGVVTGSLTTREHFLVASYATSAGRELSAGVNYKLYQFRRDCSGYCGGDEGVATTHAVDLGVQYHPAALPRLQLGADVRDLGFRLQVINAEQADRPPTRLHVSAAYDVLRHFAMDSTTSLWLAAEYERPVFAEQLPAVLSVAAELSVARLLYLRTGFRGGEGLGSGPAVGLGIHYQRFQVGIARSFYQSALTGEGAPAHITFGIGF